MGDFGLILVLMSHRGDLKYGNRKKKRNEVYFYYKIPELKN